jgi:hypothetical protein
MLDDRESRALEELERHLANQDPAFAARMRGTGSRRRFPAVSTLALVLLLVAPAIGLLFGGKVLLLIVIVIGGYVVGIFVRRHRQ